jgi:valyl-tRNA synthetase
MMRLSGQPPTLAEVEADLLRADRFILSRLAATVEAVNQALEGYRFGEAAQAIYGFIWDEFCDWYIELVKMRLSTPDSSSARAAQATLVAVLDHALRLLHPLMPFITEEIWQKLPLTERAPSIMIAPYPTGVERWRTVELEQEYALVKEAIVGVRTIRAESNVMPSKAVEATLVVPERADRDRIVAHHDEIMHLARLQSLALVDQMPDRPKSAAVKVLGKMEVVVPLSGLVDFREEAARLKKAMQKTMEEHERLCKKLSNQSFIQKAPAAVVDKDKARAQELATMIKSMEDSLRRVEADLNR